MFKANNKEVRTTLTISLFLNLSSTLNILKILHDVKNAEIRALYWNNERKVSLTDFKLKCFSPVYEPLSPEYRPIKFVLFYINAQGVLTGFYCMLI